MQLLFSLVVVSVKILRDKVRGKISDPCPDPLFVPFVPIPIFISKMSLQILFTS